MAQQYGIKNRGAIGNILGNTIEILQTIRKLNGTILGTHWEHIGNKGKKNPSPLCAAPEETN